MSRVRQAILARQSLLIYGPADSGKTALLDETLLRLADGVRKNCLVCHASESPRRIWQDLMRSLGEMNDPRVLTRVHRESDSQASLAGWLEKQTSLRLRGTLRSAMRAESYSVFIDAPGPLPTGAYRLLQEWIWSSRTPVILLARDHREHDIGKVARLFWHADMRLELGPLQPQEAETLLEHSIMRFRLTQIVDAEFRDFVLTQSEGFPGRMVRLFELASQSAYQCGGHIKLHTLAVDFLIHTKDAPQSALRARQHG